MSPVWTSTQPEAYQHAVGLLMTTMRKLPNGNLDPVFGQGDQWYFCDETWTDTLGPFPSEEAAQKAISEYAAQL